MINSTKEELEEFIAGIRISQIPRPIVVEEDKESEDD